MGILSRRGFFDSRSVLDLAIAVVFAIAATA